MWTMGSFASTTQHEVFPMIVVLTSTFIILLCMAKDLNLLVLGEKEAVSLGANVKKIQLTVLIISTFLTATTVSVSGTIGFVGLIIPHISRKIVGPNHLRLLPLCVLIGGIFMMLVDTVARSTLAVEIPIGVITSLLGGPFFLFMLRKRKNKKRRCVQ